MSKYFVVCLIGVVCLVYGGYLLGSGNLCGSIFCILGGQLVGMSWAKEEREVERE